jgi:hypothetical protein
MGISGLLPLLKSIQLHRHLSDFAGQTLAVDAYVWLHRGVYACATEVATGKPTTKLVFLYLSRGGSRLSVYSPSHLGMLIMLCSAFAYCVITKFARILCSTVGHFRPRWVLRLSASSGGKRTSQRQRRWHPREDTKKPGNTLSNVST